MIPLVSEEMNAKRETFFRMLFGRATKGYVCLAYKDPQSPRMVEYFFAYPDEMSAMLDNINRNYQQSNSYFCPQLLANKRRQKPDVAACTAVWADLDECPPSVLLLEPSITIETSPGRSQALWTLEETWDPADAEAMSHAIAYAHRGDGCDQSGWDLTQLLRIPYTYNYKYEPPAVTNIEKATTTKYRKIDFPYEDAPQHSLEVLPFPEVLPEGTAEEIMNRHRQRLIPTAWTLFSTEPQGTWSEAFFQLLMLMFEAGMTAEEVFVASKEAKCNKWVRDNAPPELLWKEVCRANARHEENNSVIIPRGSPLHELDLLTEQDRLVVQEHPTFVERYVAWATSLGDAAPVYHQAGAFIALSSMLAGNVRLHTSFGTIIPNLWFMILADTTLTRKTTAMDIAMDLIMEVDDGLILATDGSIEGLLQSLSMRPGQPSIFLRDEFSGLLEAMTRKDYMAGMAEMLTKMYDGKLQKRILRKEVIEVREPILLIFAGGIRDRVTGLLSQDHVSSGFIPRFIFITAESDPARVRPLGPPTEANLAGRDAIRAELQEMADHYQGVQVVKLPPGVGGGAAVEQKKMWRARMEDDAWKRYNDLDSRLMEVGLKAERPDLMTPTYARMVQSTLKVAMLLAASEERGDEVVIQERHIIHATYYLEGWLKHLHIVMNNIGKGTHERELDRVMGSVRRHEGISRGQLMQNHHLSARDAEQILVTLEQRQQIHRQRAGRGERIYSLTGKGQAE